MTQEAVLTDDELCQHLKIAKSTLFRHLQVGPPRKRLGAMAGDIRTIRHCMVGGQRRWSKKAVDEFIHGDGAAKS